MALLFVFHQDALTATLYQDYGAQIERYVYAGCPLDFRATDIAFSI